MTNFMEAVTLSQEQLTEADERLIRALLTNPTESAFLSAADIASRAGVHQASAVRLAKKLGFKGYPQLRASLQQELMQASEPALRLERRLSSMAGDDLLGALIGSEIQALLKITQHVTQVQLERAAQMLLAGRRVLLFARGHATSLVEFMQRRLRRMGLMPTAITAEGRDLAEQVLTLRQDDVVLAFAFHRTPPGLIPLLEHAQQVGAATLLISDTTGPLIRPQPDVLLAAPRGDEQEFQTLTVPMTLCNALILTLARSDTPRSIEALEQLTKLLEHFDGN
jgi:DNA-binding MurR/RpiR family transcriptional regulator